MSTTRERRRRAASVVVLVAGIVVLVATSQPEARTSEGFEFESIRFDGRTEVVEGSVGPVGEIPANWEDQELDLAVVADVPTAELYLEVFDEAGALIDTAYGTGEDVPVGALHELSTFRFGCPERCQGPLHYRVQRLDGGPLTVDIRVGIALTEHDATGRSGIPMEASEPKPVPRSGAARSSELASFRLEADAASPVDAALVTWRSASCQQRRSAEVAARDFTSPELRPSVRQLLMTEGGGSTADHRDANGEVNRSGPGCDLLPGGAARHFQWFVLASAAGEEVAADMVVVGPAAHVPVTVRRAEITTTVVERLRGAGYSLVDHDVAVPGSSVVTAVRPTPLPVYLLALEAPPAGGSVARYQDNQPDLQQLDDTGVGLRHAHLHIGVELAPAGPDVDPDDVRARVVLHEIGVPGS